MVRSASESPRTHHRRGCRPQFLGAWSTGPGAGQPVSTRTRRPARSRLRRRGPSAVRHRAVRYALGLGVPQDDAEAVTWYRKAAEQGHAWAQKSLWEMYAFGRGVPQDDVEAHTWLNLAASRSTGVRREIAVRARDDVELARAGVRVRVGADVRGTRNEHAASGDARDLVRGVSLDRRETVRALSPARNLRPLRGCSPSTRAAVSLTCDGEGVYARRSHLWRRRAP